MSVILAMIGGILGILSLAVAGIARSRSFGYAEAVARACHEVRGPLTAVRLGLELALRAGQLPDERVRALDLELGRATLALDDLCAVSQSAAPLARSQAGEGEQLDVTRVLADSVEALRGPAAARGVELRLVTSRSGAVLYGERLRLAQAIENLIANAIEHGGGIVDISWRLERSTIRIEVVDGGDGLPAGVAELVRAGRVGHRAWGSGVLPGRRHVTRRGHGLAIAIAVAAAHGGRLTSAPTERGARLILELPAAEPTPLATSAGA